MFILNLNEQDTDQNDNRISEDPSLQYSVFNVLLLPATEAKA